MCANTLGWFLRLILFYLLFLIRYFFFLIVYKEMDGGKNDEEIIEPLQEIAQAMAWAKADLQADQNNQNGSDAKCMC